jgi:hypothetical protein
MESETSHTSQKKYKFSGLHNNDRPKSKILKILKNFDFNILKSKFFNIFNILLFGRWIKSINPSPHNVAAYLCNKISCVDSN